MGAFWKRFRRQLEPPERGPLFRDPRSAKKEAMSSNNNLDVTQAKCGTIGPLSPTKKQEYIYATN
jgi:hypothetical protein